MTAAPSACCPPLLNERASPRPAASMICRWVLAADARDACAAGTTLTWTPALLVGVRLQYGGRSFSTAPIRRQRDVPLRRRRVCLSHCRRADKAARRFACAFLLRPPDGAHFGFSPWPGERADRAPLLCPSPRRDCAQHLPMADASNSSGERAPSPPAPPALAAGAAAADEEAALPFFDLLLSGSNSAFGVMSLADMRILYVSPNVERVFRLPVGALLGCARARSPNPCFLLRCKCRTLGAHRSRARSRTRAIERVHDMSSQSTRASAATASKTARATSVLPYRLSS